ncbi:PAS domain S-box protein [Spirulina subsalsa]|uniref:PAS domain S-box protein n=1 Tax=Spirulina subsalsa TaxID=54311 RepID=UPI0002F26614|nr:PAS domain S-box protein [Spirulina subsalsa]
MFNSDVALLGYAEIDWIEVSPNAVLLDVLQQMTQRQKSYVLVMAQKRCVGIFTERDVVSLAALQQDFRQVAIASVMTPNPVMLYASQVCHIFEVLLALKKYQIRHLPLLGEEEQLLGVFTHDSLCRNLQLTDIPTQPTTSIEKAYRKLAAHVSNSPLAVIEWDEKMRVMSWSKRAEEIFGWTEEEVFGKALDEWLFVYPEDWEKVQNTVDSIKDPHKAQNICHNRNYTKTGNIVFCEWYNSSLFNEDGSLVSLMSLALDVTNRIEAETALRQSESRLKAIVEQAGVGIAYTIPSGEFLLVNQYLCNLLGYSEDELMNLSFYDVTHPDDLPRDFEYIQKAIEEDLESVSWEKRYISKSGQAHWVEITVSVVRDSQGGLESGIGIVQDIQNRKMTEQQIQSRLKAEQVLAQISQYLATHNPYDFNRVLVKIAGVIRVNRVYLYTILGDENSHFLGQTLYPVSPLSYSFQRTYEWHDEETFSLQEKFKLLNLVPFQWWLRQLLQHKRVVLEHPEDLPPQAHWEKVLLTVQGTCSVLEIGIFTPKGELWGVLGLSTMGEWRKVWLEEDIQLLSIVGEMIYAYADRQQTYEALQLSEERYSIATQSANIGVWDTNLKNREIYYSPDFIASLGYSVREIGTSCERIQQLIHPEDREKVIQHSIQYLRGEQKTYDIEYRLLCKSQAVRWVLSRAKAIRDDQGIPYRLVGTSIDITSLKSATEQLSYRLKLETALTQISQQLVKLEPFSALEEDRSRWHFDLEPILLCLGRAMGIQRAYLVRFDSHSHQGSWVAEWCEAGLNHLQDDLQNIDTRAMDWWMLQLRANRAIALSQLDELPPSAHTEEQFLRELQFNSILEIPMLDSSGQLWGAIGLATTVPHIKNWLELDQKLLRIIGELIYNHYSRREAELKLQASEALYAGIFNHSAEVIWLVQVLPEEQFVYETINPCYEEQIGVTREEIIGKSPYEVYSLPIAQHLTQSYQACVEAGETLSYEETLAFPIGTRTWRTLLVPIRNSQGQIHRILGSARDITEDIRQKEELARSNAELEQFAYVASHDLQAPLGIINSYAQLLQQLKGEQLDEQSNRYLERIVRGCERMQTMINDLLQYSRVQRKPKEFQACELGEIIQDAIANLELDISQSRASLRISELPTVQGDRSQLLQLLQNLLSNAIKYRGNHPPEIQVSAQFLENHWQIAIQDNGIGIPPKHQARIFQIFQRLHTANEYPGSGIGLAICEKIVQRHGGKIWVKSQEKQGSTFYLTFPPLDPM